MNHLLGEAPTINLSSSFFHPNLCPIFSDHRRFPFSTIIYCCSPLFYRIFTYYSLERRRLLQDDRNPITFVRKKRRLYRTDSRDCSNEQSFVSTLNKNLTQICRGNAFLLLQHGVSFQQSCFHSLASFYYIYIHR